MESRRHDRYQALTARLARIDNAGTRRFLRTVTPVSATEGIVEGHRVTLFCTNDYLGLAHHPEVVAAWRGAGAGAARLISGNRPVHDALEAELSERFGRPATLFSSGYHANLALFATVPQSSDRVASDALNHASIIDGLRLSRAERVVIPHGSVAVPEGTRLIAAEGLFSMDGDFAPVAHYPLEPWLAVDEAHAIGCLGPSGTGVAAAAGVTADFIVGTFGKALGSAGAFVVGPPELRELLLSSARAFIYTTALPEPAAAAALVALGLADDERRERLSANAARLRAGLVDRGVAALGVAHIVPIRTRDPLGVAARLLSAGFLAPGVRHPTVPTGEERVRLTVSAEHSHEQIDRCVEAVAGAMGG